MITSIQVFSNVMIFQCMDFFLVIFQVFHDFQSLWDFLSVKLHVIISFFHLFNIDFCSGPFWVHKRIVLFGQFL